MQLLTKREVAGRLRVCERTINRWMVTGEGPTGIRIGGRIMFREDQFDAWLASRS